MENNMFTVGGYAETELIIEKSRFIVYTDRVNEITAAQNFIQELKKKHWDANHNCSAYLIGTMQQKADDDGEPSGTAGIPILEVLKKHLITDTVIVVTRYFGGIKLGKGGLIRAYGKAARLGLQAAGIVNRVKHLRFAVEIDYQLAGLMERELRKNAYTIQRINYLQTVTMIVAVEAGLEQKFSADVVNWSSGNAQVTYLDTIYVDKRIVLGEQGQAQGAPRQ